MVRRARRGSGFGKGLSPPAETDSGVSTLPMSPGGWRKGCSGQSAQADGGLSFPTGTSSWEMNRCQSGQTGSQPMPVEWAQCVRQGRDAPHPACPPLRANHWHTGPRRNWAEGDVRWLHRAKRGKGARPPRYGKALREARARNGGQHGRRLPWRPEALRCHGFLRWPLVLGACTSRFHGDAGAPWGHLLPVQACRPGCAA